MCRHSKLHYHSFAKQHPLLTDENREEVRRHFFEIIVIPGYSFAVVTAVLSVILCIVTNNLYYVILCSIIYVIMFLSVVRVTWSLYVGEFHLEEFQLADHLNCQDILLGVDIRDVAGTKSSLQVIKFQSRQFILFVLYTILVFGVSLGHVVDKFSPPAGSSSCTRTWNGKTTNPYNPAGFFSDNTIQYSDNVILKMFPMDQTYANPVLNDFIIGYSTSPLDDDVSNACSTVLPPDRTLPRTVNGFVDTDRCEGSYPSPVLGIATNMTPTTYGAEYLLCGGNTGSAMCINPSTGQAFLPSTVPGTSQCQGVFRIGRPRKICVSCLQAYRADTGDEFGPDGYSHCNPYDPSIGYSLICLVLSPRMGLMRYARYDDASLIGALVITSIQLLAWIVYFIVNITYQVLSEAHNIKVKFR